MADKKELKEDLVIKEVTEELFKLLGVEGKVDVVEVTSEAAEIVLETEDTGIIIGYHGETLDALQIVLAAIITKKLGKFVRVSLETGEYKKNRTDWLQNLARETKEKALAENRQVTLFGLKPWERRIVHLSLQEDKEVVSESEGEGKERVLVIKPR